MAVVKFNYSRVMYVNNEYLVKHLDGFDIISRTFSQEFDFAAIHVTACDVSIVTSVTGCGCKVLPLYIATLLLVRVSQNNLNPNLLFLSLFIHPST